MSFGIIFLIFCCFWVTCTADLKWEIKDRQSQSKTYSYCPNRTESEYYGVMQIMTGGGNRTLVASCKLNGRGDGTGKVNEGGWNLTCTDFCFRVSVNPAVIKFGTYSFETLYGKKTYMNTTLVMTESTDTGNPSSGNGMKVQAPVIIGSILLTAVIVMRFL